ncbi:MAG TPA: sensor histidine kinase [Desulfobulbus sp.]|nr:sensor histidine kinase [Desulfobulbus sp.]
MRVRGIRFHLAVHFMMLLLLAMVMVNLVLVIFWYHDASRNEIQRDRIILACRKQLLIRRHGEKNVATASEARFMANIRKKIPGLQLVVRPAPGGRDVPGRLSGAPPILSQLVTQAIRTGKPALYRTGLLSAIFDPRTMPITVIAEPVLRDNRIIGAVGLYHYRRMLFDSLWQAEKAIVVYILINLLFFGILHYLRITSLVARPIGRLADLADRYTDHSPTFFAIDRPGDEFDRLSSSLNMMLSKLEEDRTTLERAVTDLALANQRLKKQQKEMVHAEKLASIGRMASGLAHEIGNPLGVVQGYLGLLAGSSTITAEEKDFINRAEQELHRMASLIRQLLHYGRMTRGVPEDVSVHEVLRSTVEMIAIQPSFRAISIEYRFSAKDDIVNIDRNQLKQVFINCLQNSGDAILAAKKNGHILISTYNHFQDPVGRLIILIQDNGIGIPPDIINEIFDPFVTSKPPGQGTGLGLSVSLSIIEGANGRMTARNITGGGTKMHIELPLSLKHSSTEDNTVPEDDFGKGTDTGE